MKVALVTGATGGIGRRLVRGLMNRGYHVVGVGRNEAKLVELSRMGSFSYVVTDLSEDRAVLNVLKAFRDMGLNELDLLINNAGFALRRPLLEHSCDEIEAVFRVNTLVPIELTKSFLPFMREGSAVVFVISGVAFINVPELPSYCSAKGALHYLAINLERELKARGVRVVRVYPKHVRTGFWRGKVPKGSMKPEAVARAILNGVEEGKREIFIPGYLKIVKYLPNWPVFTYRFRY